MARAAEQARSGWRDICSARDFPEVERHAARTPAEQMGMSYELADAHVEDMRASVWRLTRVTFTGAAILLREKAAYGKDVFPLVRSESTERESKAGSCSAREPEQSQ